MTPLVHVIISVKNEQANYILKMPSNSKHVFLFTFPKMSDLEYTELFQYYIFALQQCFQIPLVNGGLKGDLYEIHTLFDLQIIPLPVVNFPGKLGGHSRFKHDASSDCC